jgi:CxxC motif-containing protein
MTINKTCIICPIGCSLSAEYDESTKKIENLTGAACKRGVTYMTQELLNPMRTIQSSVLVIDGVLPLASVKTSALIPKDKIFEVMKLVKSIRLAAPVEAGFIAKKNVLDLDVDIVVTKTVNKNQ